MSGDRGWAEAVHAAIAHDDKVRLETLAVVAGSLIDLKSEMASADWEKLYETLSDKLGVKPKQALALVHD
ncbi:MAG TPA: hypothetical protein VKD00_06900 [Methyloceanibacter sp.]|nr:hypothetical protein [Methyloceanibacter sp.]